MQINCLGWLQMLSEGITWAPPADVGRGLPLEGVSGGIPDKQLYHGGVELPAVLQLPHPDFP